MIIILLLLNFFIVFLVDFGSIEPGIKIIIDCQFFLWIMSGNRCIEHAQNTGGIRIDDE